VVSAVLDVDLFGETSRGLLTNRPSALCVVTPIQPPVLPPATDGTSVQNSPCSPCSSMVTPECRLALELEPMEEDFM